MLRTPPESEFTIDWIISDKFTPKSAIFSLSDLFNRSVWSSASNILSSSFVMTWAFDKSVLNPSSSAVLLSPFTIKSVFTAVAFVSLSFKCSTVIFSIFPLKSKSIFY